LILTYPSPFGAPLGWPRCISPRSLTSVIQSSWAFVWRSVSALYYAKKTRPFVFKTAKSWTKMASVSFRVLVDYSWVAHWITRVSSLHAIELQTCATICVSWNVVNSVVRITQTNRVSAWWALSTIYFLFGYLYTRRHTTNMRCSSVLHILCNAEVSRTCYKQTSPTNSVAYDTAPSWTRTTMADGHTFSVVKRLSQRFIDRSKSAIFNYPTCIWQPRWGWFHRNFVKVIKLQSSWAIVPRLFLIVR